MSIESAYRHTDETIIAYNNCMGERQMRTSNAKMSSSRHQLAPNAKCAVCNDDASGYHYGVDSCEGCKGFFRRCITQGINFRCSNEEKCQITPFTRNSCQYCRLKKCFQVGMSREASRLGRRPKKVMKSSNLSRDVQAQLTKHIDTKPQTSNSSNAMDYPDLANVALSEFFGFSPAMMSKFGSMMPSVMGNMSGMSSVGVGSVPFSPAMAQSPNKAAMMAQFTGHDSSSPLNLSDMQPKHPQEPVKMPTEHVTHMDLNKWREKQFEVMSKYMHNKDTGSVEDRTASETSSVDMTNPSGQSKDNSPLSLNSLTSSPVEGAMLDDVMPQESDITVMSEAQQQRLQRFMHYVSLGLEEDIIELIGQVNEGIVSSHMEHCYHQRPRIFAVSAELDAKEQSGEDVRPPSGFWSHWMSEMLPAIERVVRFLKDIPGFRELPINDQILLIKKGAFDIVLSQAMPMIDPDKRTMLDPQLKYRNRREDFESLPEPFRNLFDDHFVLSKEFKMAGITDKETALINAILGVNSGIEGFENANGVKKLECLFVQTLHDHVIKTHPDQPHRFDSLIRLIPLVDNTSQAHASSLHNIKCNVSFSGQNFPPLHKEIFS